MKKLSMIIVTIFFCYNNAVGQEVQKSEDAFKSGNTTLSLLRKSDELPKYIEVYVRTDNFVSIHVPDGLDYGSRYDLIQSLEEFRQNLRRYESKLPEYDFYSIEYVDGIKLEITEVVGKEIYRLNNSDSTYIQSSNTCTLRSGGNEIVILFSEIEELLDDRLIEDINSATTSLLEKEKEIRRGVIAKLGTYRYDAKTGISNASTAQKLRIGLGIDFQFNGTYVNDRFFYDFWTNLYINVSKWPNLYLGVAINPLYTFSVPLDEQITDGFFGPSIGYKDKGGSFNQFGFLWKAADRNSEIDNIVTKIYVKRRVGNLNLGYDVYNIFRRNQQFALSIGFTF